MKMFCLLCITLTMLVKVSTLTINLETLDSVCCLSVITVLETQEAVHGVVVVIQVEYLSIEVFVEIFRCLHSSQ